MSVDAQGSTLDDYAADAGGHEGPTLVDVYIALRQRLSLLLVAPTGVGLVALGIAFVIPPTFTAETTFMPPQQAQGMAASALASLGSLASLAGGAAGIRNTGDQYLALMQSVTVSDRLIDQYDLMKAYQVEFKVDARRTLNSNVRITLGKKDGMISVAVDDTDPKRAAAIANRYVDELRRVTGELAVTEAQQRRTFFERELAQSRDRLITAQQALQASGFNAGALKAEPKSAAEAYTRLKAEAISAEVRLQVLRRTLTDDTPEVRQQGAVVSAIQEQLARNARSSAVSEGPDYISRYREFKYQETLFELYARQFELARADESREGALIQVVDPATVPEKKSKPKRAFIAVSASVISGLLLAVWILFKAFGKSPSVRRSSPETGTTAT